MFARSPRSVHAWVRERHERDRLYYRRDIEARHRQEHVGDGAVELIPGALTVRSRLSLAVYWESNRVSGRKREKDIDAETTGTLGEVGALGGESRCAHTLTGQAADLTTTGKRESSALDGGPLLSDLSRRWARGGCGGGTRSLYLFLSFTRSFSLALFCRRRCTAADKIYMHYRTAVGERDE